MKRKGTVIGIIIALLLGGAFVYRFTHLTTGKGEEHAEKTEAGEPKGKDEGKEEKQGAQEKTATVKMDPEVQKRSGVVVDVVRKKSLGGVIAATGKVEVNADRIAHVTPRISGKIVAVGASLGDNVGAGQVLARLDSVELGEALSRYHQAKTRLALAKNNMDRVKTLVEKKIAARKDILQAETDYQTALTELHTDEERLLLYGLARRDLAALEGKRILLPVRSPIGGIVTEKHAIVGELADPSKSLYTVADLSTVWVMVDINEKDLAKVSKGQAAVVTVGAFPETKFKGRVALIADLVDEATRTVKARVEVQNPGRRLKPEMFATVELTLPATGPGVVAVPEEAVQELEGKKIIFVTEDGKEFTPREVQLGIASGGLVEVTSGLKEGERYAVKGSFLLKSELKKGELGEE
ncbi:efflux RND transporter periplasmic adaptor subunit [Geobacter sp.]|uniref:efflux RND transporter periplasmic adaptor subunit n=1 Tax=Geobacter sp. TaxID=46610 RepID=UPI002613DC1D|nr:efflux RND transporter periplasmic adaptor subunit [Geobacter sp.]